MMAMRPLQETVRLRERLREADDTFALEPAALRAPERPAIACHGSLCQPTPPRTGAVMPSWLPSAGGDATEFQFRQRIPSGVGINERPASA